MNKREILKEKINKCTPTTFEELAMEVFYFQYQQNQVYQSYCDLLKGKGFRPKDLDEIPFLPVSFFKSHKIQSYNAASSTVYKSSATTGSIQSKHYILDQHFYLHNALKTFEAHYGDIKGWTIFALLPGYIERGDSSLIDMVQYFIDASQNMNSGFYLNEFDQLLHNIQFCKSSGKKLLLIGVSFALLQLADRAPDLSDVIVMETGGMKGKGKELPKKAFHNVLKNAFNVPFIHSEYGMTELQAQAYSKGNGLFLPTDTMKIKIKELTDPLHPVPNGKSGVINVIDLINVDTCSFIETQDLGILHSSGNFELLGRVDAAEIRGCNLLVADL